MPINKQVQDDTVVRRTKLLQARRERRSFAAIWEELGYSSRGAASKDYWRICKEHEEDFAVERGLLQQQARDDLDELLGAVWVKAMKGDVRSHDQALKVVAMKVKLDRLDTVADADGMDDAKSMLAQIGLAFTALSGALPDDE
jgi:hypothetical protein